MSPTDQKASWDVRNDGLLPLADALDEILRPALIDPASTIPDEHLAVTPQRIEILYVRHDVERVIAWLKFRTSLDYAAEFSERLNEPVRSFQQELINYDDWGLGAGSPEFHEEYIDFCKKLSRIPAYLRQVAEFSGDSRQSMQDGLPGSEEELPAPTIKKIADFVGVSTQTIRNARKAAGLKPGKIGDHQHELSPDEVWNIGCHRLESRECGDREKDRWEKIRRGMNLPSFESKPTARRKTKPKA